MGGRPRTPTNLLDARGAFNKHPERRKDRKDEPVVTDPLGESPKTFTADQLQAWNDIVKMAPAGVLTKADTIAVENAARLLALERIGKASDAQGRRLDSLLGKFGMTPSERSKVSVPKKAPESRWSKHGS
jgi:hypothetical protein